jgi:hypothetical protein
MQVIARMNVGGPAWQVSVLTRGLEDAEFTTNSSAVRWNPAKQTSLRLRDPDLPVTRLIHLAAP